MKFIFSLSILVCLFVCLTSGRQQSEFDAAAIKDPHPSVVLQGGGAVPDDQQKTSEMHHPGFVEGLQDHNPDAEFTDSRNYDEKSNGLPATSSTLPPSNDVDRHEKYSSPRIQDNAPVDMESYVEVIADEKNDGGASFDHLHRQPPTQPGVPPVPPDQRKPPVPEHVDIRNLPNSKHDAEYPNPRTLNEHRGERTRAPIPPLIHKPKTFGQYEPRLPIDDMFHSPDVRQFNPFGERQHEHAVEPKDDDFVSFTVVIYPATKQCFFYLPISNFIIDYQVLRGGALDLGLYIRDPNGEPIATRHPSPDGSLTIKVPPVFVSRPYAVCLDNRKASYGPKHVSLSIDLDINWDNPSPRELVAIEKLRKRSFMNTQHPTEDANYIEAWKSIIVQLEGLFGRLRRIGLLQQKSDNFASIDQGLMEANIQRVTSGSIWQLLTMISVAWIQVLLIRALFDPSSWLYRIWFGKRSSVNARC